MAKIDYILGKVMEGLLFLGLFLTAAVTLLQVVFRYVLGQSLAWSQEFVLICFVYTVLFGAVLGIKNSEHLQVDLLDKAPEPIRKISVILEFLIVIALISVLVYYGFQLFLNNLQSGQIVGILPVPVAYVYLAIPVSGLFMLYFQVRKVMKK
ncbi:TRAP transporter small permease [Bacillus sp. FJAT-44742]|uniref:TRAP transporter small permease n=1 Tax=Bacillus sp. FJAT-44742 TaxID=2014005 RepID=UPI000C23B89D|nr:TRAP transporter small permease [Bacillus sp. FJAT-44742]